MSAIRLLTVKELACFRRAEGYLQKANTRIELIILMCHIRCSMLETCQHAPPSRPETYTRRLSA